MQSTDSFLQMIHIILRAAAGTCYGKHFLFDCFNKTFTIYRYTFGPLSLPEIVTIRR